MLFLICPQCGAKEPLTAAACLGCGADLRHLPLVQRHSFLEQPREAEVLPPSPEDPPVAAAPAFPEVELVETGPGVWIPAATASLTWEQDYLKHVPNEAERVSLCETLDRILNKGAVVVGEVTLAVADIDLIFLGLQLILTSVETARELRSSQEPGPWAGVAR